VGHDSHDVSCRESANLKTAKEPSMPLVLVHADGRDVEAIRAGARHIGAVHMPSDGMDPPGVLAIITRLYHELDHDPGWGGWIVTKADDAVGFCSLTGPPHDGACEIGYSIFEAFRGRGYATGAVMQAIAAIRQHGLTRILAETTHENAASHAVLTKCGFARSGERFDPEDGDVVTWQRKL
jgi:RimJ/RimL family protein N-acetyltransferase